MVESSSRFCVVCGVEEEVNKVGVVGGSGSDRKEIFSKDVKLSKFCGELELSSLPLNLNGDKGFTAFNFLEQLDNYSNYVKICGECSVLIGETVEKKGELEGVECEVLELQIKLLIKLKEMEGLSKVYLEEMRKIREKVKRSQLNGFVDGNPVFGQVEEICGVVEFRERILNVVTSLAMFRDNLDAKIYSDRERTSRLPEEMEESPSPPEWIPSMDDSSNDFNDNLSLSSPPSPPPLSPDLDDLGDTVQTLEEIKMETDNLTESKNEEDELKLNNDKADDKPLIKKANPSPRNPSKRIPNAIVNQRAKINREKFRQVNWRSMGPLRRKLIKEIYIPQSRTTSGIDDLLEKYKWSYDPPQDQVHFGGHPIQIRESEDKTTLTFNCLSCDQASYSINCLNSPPADPSNKPITLSEEIRRGISNLKRKITDHVLSSHLNCFNCSKCTKPLNITTLERFRCHLKTHEGSSPSVGRRGRKAPVICHICGKSLSERNLKKHLILHKLNSGELSQEEKDQLKKFVCSVCGKRFVVSKACELHEVTHWPKEERVKVTCSFCGKEVLKRCYSTHKRMYCAEGQGKVMPCQICGKSYKSGKSLGDHLVRTHKLAKRPKLDLRIN